MFHVAIASDLRSANVWVSEGKSAADGDQTPLNVLSYVGCATGAGSGEHLLRAPFCLDRFHCCPGPPRPCLFWELRSTRRGYEVHSLQTHVQKILGIGEGWPMALIGVGNLGSALLAYDGFPRQGFRIVEAFDSDPRRVGTVIRDVVVKPMDQIKETIQARHIVMALLAVPAKAAQGVTEQLVAAGVRCLLNFAPVTLKVPPHVHLASVDLSIEVEYLSYVLRESVAEGQAAEGACSDVPRALSG